MNDINKIVFKDADKVAEQYLECQMNLREKSKFANILVILLTMGFIYAFAVLFWVLPDKEYSADENRPLQQTPEFTWERLVEGQYIEDITTYMADQFPARNFFTGLHAASELAQGRQQVGNKDNSVMVGDDGYLVARNDFPSLENLEKNITAAGMFIEALEKSDINYTVALAGRKQDVCDNKLSPLYGSYYSDMLFDNLDAMCRENGVDYINLRDLLRKHHTEGESVYYRNDHHWNSYGAYLAYSEIADSVGYEAYSLDDFGKEVATKDFFGTTWSSSGVRWAKGDQIDYYRWNGDADFTMRVLDEKGQLKDKEGCTVEVGEDNKSYSVFSSYFVRDFLDEKDKYASFIGGNFGYTEITMNGDGERETLLMLKDSFSHSMVQYLARHYDLVMVDLRYYKQNIFKLCEEKGIDNVLFLYNMETLTESSDLNILRSGLKNIK